MTRLQEGGPDSVSEFNHSEILRNVNTSIGDTLEHGESLGYTEASNFLDTITDGLGRALVSLATPSPALKTELEDFIPSIKAAKVQLPHDQQRGADFIVAAAISFGQAAFVDFVHTQEDRKRDFFWTIGPRSGAPLVDLNFEEYDNIVHDLGSLSPEIVQASNIGVAFRSQLREDVGLVLPLLMTTDQDFGEDPQSAAVATCLLLEGSLNAWQIDSKLQAALEQPGEKYLEQYERVERILRAFYFASPRIIDGARLTTDGRKRIVTYLRSIL